MRILVLSNLYPPHVLGGYEILCAQVCGELLRRGHAVRVLTSGHGTGGAPDGGDAEGDGVLRALQLYRPFGTPAGRDRRLRARAGRHNGRVVAGEVAAWAPDVVFVWSQLRLSLGGARAAERSGRPVAYTFNDDHPAGYLPAPFGLRPRGFVAFLLDATLFRSATTRPLAFRHTTCISRTLKEVLLEKGLPVPECRVIYQGIPVERFPVKEGPGALGRPARLLYAGQLHSYKGVHTFLEAASRLAARGFPLALTVAGAGDAEYVRRLRGQADGAGCPVAFPGRVPHAEVPALYQSHDIFVFPSVWREPFGLTHLEAMASGTPVVSTADGGHGEFLQDGVNALVFRKEDPEHLAARLEELLTRPETALRLARQAREMVCRDFSLARYAGDLEAFLAEIAGPAGGGRP